MPTWNAPSSLLMPPHSSSPGLVPQSSLPTPWQPRSAISRCLVLTPQGPQCQCLSLKSFLLSQPSPAPVLHFFLDGRWGTSRERLAISKDQRAVRSVPGLPLLLAAERLLTGCHLSVDVVLGDVAVTQGRSYWACAVDPASYLVKVGVGLESKLQESFQGAPDVISPRSGLSGRDEGIGPWVGELGTGRGWQGEHICWDGAAGDEEVRGAWELGWGACGQEKCGLSERALSSAVRSGCGKGAISTPLPLSLRPSL